MITIEQLNAIPGRPSFLTEWVIAYDVPCCYHKDGPLLVERGRLAISYHDRLFCFSLNHQATRDLLAFATYTRRVEIEIERMGHEEKFLDGSTVCDRDDAIQYAYDRYDSEDDDRECIEVTITPAERVYPEKCVDLEGIGEQIIDQCFQDDGGRCPNLGWKSGASEVLSVFLATYADLDPWYNGSDEESVTLRVTRNSEGFWSGWEEVE